jgi:uncharacterized protein YndB with AHSA1/START domain
MTTGKHELIITRTFDAPRQLVWNVWTQPEQVMKWWGPGPFMSPACKIDLRVGGHYLYCMRGPDGKDYWSGGTYKEIVPIKKLVYIDAFADEEGNWVDPAAYGFDAIFPKTNVVTVTFEEVGTKTKLTIHYITDSEAVLEVMRKTQMKEGWESSLDKFERALAK